MKARLRFSSRVAECLLSALSSSPLWAGLEILNFLPTEGSRNDAGKKSALPSEQVGLGPFVIGERFSPDDSRQSETELFIPLGAADEIPVETICAVFDHVEDFLLSLRLKRATGLSRLARDGTLPKSVDASSLDSIKISMATLIESRGFGDDVREEKAENGYCVGDMSDVAGHSSERFLFYELRKVVVPAE